MPPAYRSLLPLPARGATQPAPASSSRVQTTTSTVLVGFALHNRGGVVPLPARVTRTWRGLPIADPDVWLRAYRLLQRHDRADLLQHWHEEAGPPVTGP